MNKISVDGKMINLSDAQRFVDVHTEHAHELRGEDLL